MTYRACSGLQPTDYIATEFGAIVGITYRACSGLQHHAIIFGVDCPEVILTCRARSGESQPQTTMARKADGARWKPCGELLACVRPVVPKHTATTLSSSRGPMPPCHVSLLVTHYQTVGTNGYYPHYVATPEVVENRKSERFSLMTIPPGQWHLLAKHLVWLHSQRRTRCSRYAPGSQLAPGVGRAHLRLRVETHAPHVLAVSSCFTPPAVSAFAHKPQYPAGGYRSLITGGCPATDALRHAWALGTRNTVGDSLREVL
jgi:hypothetical protein